VQRLLVLLVGVPCGLLLPSLPVTPACLPACDRCRTRYISIDEVGSDLRNT
jgi:hypothetical protein